MYLWKPDMLSPVDKHESIQKGENISKCVKINLQCDTVSEFANHY